MNELLKESGPYLAVAAVVVNFVWTSLNLRLLRTIEKKFVTREYFHQEMKVRNVKHSALAERVRKLEGAA